MWCVEMLSLHLGLVIFDVSYARGCNVLLGFRRRSGQTRGRQEHISESHAFGLESGVSIHNYQQSARMATITVTHSLIL